MGVGVVLARAVVLIALRRRIERRELLEPFFVVGMQPRLIIVNEDAGRNVHRIHKAQSVANAASLYRLLNVGRNVHEVHAGRNVER